MSISNHRVDYNNLVKIKFAEINFIQVDTTAISPVISLGYDEFFKAEKLDKDNFRQADTDTITCLANNLNHFLSLSIELIKNYSSKNPLAKVF